ncbi:Mu-like prophage FluMu protein com (modular protein) [Nitrospira japonica]|uniref:Mu-like prophage FluMu protein com (Modular protein) n=1 Tax=Nitrospira japonica TaxID=1325564 RepID=A0A1W1I5G2_9BACT|nr:Mu-like prophage FluMu protein com (modular protein) [Nitrospira japonica]
MNNVSSSACSVQEARCECGQLIAKVLEKGLELKCKRCKRIVIIPFTAIVGWSDLSPKPIS